MAGKRGPRKLPATVKIARGTYKPSRDGQPEEVIGAQIVLPAPPETLGEPGRAAWFRHGKVAESCGQLEERFLAALERLCDAYDRLANARKDIDENGRTAITEKGFEHARPAVAMERESREEIRRYLVEFGWTPSSATGVRLSGQKQSKGVQTRKRA